MTETNIKKDKILGLTQQLTKLLNDARYAAKMAYGIDNDCGDLAATYISTAIFNLKSALTEIKTNANATK